MHGLAAPYFAPSVRPRSARIVLYLDFDGVLHHEAAMWSPKRGAFISPIDGPGRTLFEWAHHLEAELVDFPDVKLVLSSSWCVKPGFGKSIKRLSANLQRRFIGGTFHKRFHGIDPWTTESFRAAPRWKQILGDAQRREPSAWLVLDDDVADWPAELRANLVACNGATGLSCAEVRDELHSKLLTANDDSKLDHYAGYSA